MFNSMTLYIGSVIAHITDDHLKLNRYLFCLYLTIIIIIMIIRDYLYLHSSDHLVPHPVSLVMLMSL